MDSFFANLIDNLSFILQRINWLSILDLLLVTLVFFSILLLLRDTQAMVLLRGVLLLVVLVSLLSSLAVLPAFSWLVSTTLPALVLAIPVIFAPEIRRALERLGRAGFLHLNGKRDTKMQSTINAVVSAAMRLSDRRHGALIVIQRSDSLDEYMSTGVRMDAQVTPELLLQVFYPNTPLHDGAVILTGTRLVAAACVMPLSASGVLTHSPDRQMGLRHRAALGISEVTDAVTVVVSEETGAISVVHGGRMIRRLDQDRLYNILLAFFQPSSQNGTNWLERLWGVKPDKPPEAPKVKLSPWRWLVKNFSTLLLAFAMAVIVWVSAVWAADPNEVRVLERNIPIEYIGQSPNLQLMGDPQDSISLSLNAPNSVWNELNANLDSVRAWVDLTSREAGEYTLPVQIQIIPRLVRLVSQEPEEITVLLEPLVTQSYTVTAQLIGSPPTGYQAGEPVIEPGTVSVTGPESSVAKVKELRVAVDINGESETVNRTTTPIPLDADGRAVNGLVITPEKVQVTVPIDLLGGFRYVIVRPVTLGHVSNGYKLTNISVSPTGLVVFSSDPQLIDDLPGYVETKAIDLTDASDDFETLVDLNLPEGVVAVGDPKVLIQVSIAAIESSLAVSLPIDVVGLTPGLQASVSPLVVDLILSGPVPVLNSLEPSDIRVIIDLTGYGEGTYQVVPVVDFLPEGVSIVSMLPSTIEVTISLAPTPTITPTLSATPSPTATPTPAAKATP